MLPQNISDMNQYRWQYIASMIEDPKIVDIDLPRAKVREHELAMYWTLLETLFKPVPPPISIFFELDDFDPLEDLLDLPLLLDLLVLEWE